MPRKPSSRSKPYTQESVETALKAVRSGMTLSNAAREFNVPRTTIFNKLNGKSPVNCRTGPRSTLTPDQEQELVKWILDCSDQVHPITTDQVLDSVEMMCKYFKIPNKFANGRPSNDWLKNFMKRHPELSCRTFGRNALRRTGTAQEKVKKSFKEVGDYLEQSNLKDLPRNRVFTCDETGFFLTPKVKKILIRRVDHASGRVITPEEKDCATVFFAVSASGQLVPPMVVHPVKRFSLGIAKAGIGDWLMGRSDSGRVTNIIFYQYIANAFYPWLQRQKIPLPVVLYVDGQSSYLSLEIMKFCKEKGIELIRVYPHSTQWMQPLDTAFYAPLKIAWINALCKWKMENNWGKLQRRYVAKVLFEALKDLNLEVIAEKGFRECGLLPFNPDVINQEKVKTENQSFEDPILPADDYKTALRVLETHLSPTMLEKFTICNENDFWDGPVEKEGLFQYWKEMKRMYAIARSSGYAPIFDANESSEPEDIKDIPVVFCGTADPAMWNREDDVA